MTQFVRDEVAKFFASDILTVPRAKRLVELMLQVDQHEESQSLCLFVNDMTGLQHAIHETMKSTHLLLQVIQIFIMAERDEERKVEQNKTYGKA